MTKYISLSKEVYAEQFFVDSEPWPKGVKLRCGERTGVYYIVITIHGQETDVVDGDWIIQEPDGVHYYPCKPDIFKLTYKKAGD